MQARASALPVTWSLACLQALEVDHPRVGLVGHRQVLERKDLRKGEQRGEVGGERLVVVPACGRCGFRVEGREGGREGGESNGLYEGG